MTKLTKTFKSSATPNTIPSKRVQMSTVEKEINRPGKGYEKLELGKQRQSVENRQAPHFLAHAPRSKNETNLHGTCNWAVCEMLLNWSS